MGYLPLSTIFPVFFIKKKKKKSRKKPTTSQRRQPHETVELSNPWKQSQHLIQNVFVLFFPPPRSLPSSVDTKEAAILWANDSKKILGPQCVHSSLDSLVLGRAFKCEGTMRQFKGKVQQFGSKTSFSGIGPPKRNVIILWTKHLSCK